MYSSFVLTWNNDGSEENMENIFGEPAKTLLVRQVVKTNTELDPKNRTVVPVTVESTKWSSKL